MCVMLRLLLLMMALLFDTDIETIQVAKLHGGLYLPGAITLLFALVVIPVATGVIFVNPTSLKLQHVPSVLVFNRCYVLVSARARAG